MSLQTLLATVLATGAAAPAPPGAWRLFSFARIDKVAGAANESSPLVRQTTGARVGVGLAYDWMRSQTSARD